MLHRLYSEISHFFLEYVKFPTNHTFHRNFAISTWEILSGNLTCMLERNWYLTRIHVNTLSICHGVCSEPKEGLQLIVDWLRIPVTIQRYH